VVGIGFARDVKAKDKGNTNSNRKVLRRKARLRMTSFWEGKVA
jgi:hypothetical protein